MKIKVDERIGPLDFINALYRSNPDEWSFKDHPDSKGISVFWNGKEADFLFYHELSYKKVEELRYWGWRWRNMTMDEREKSLRWRSYEARRRAKKAKEDFWKDVKKEIKQHVVKGQKSISFGG